MATYRELIQDIISDLDKVYDKCGALRDAADWPEKAVYNDTRGAISSLLSKWRTFDNKLPDNRASMQLGWSLPDWK